MEKEKFRQWCDDQESKLFRRSVSFIISDWAFVIVYSWLGIDILITRFILNIAKDSGFFIFNYISQSLFSWIVGIILLAIFIFFFIKLAGWFTSLSKVEYISCMLNKIANQLQFVKEESKNEGDLIKSLKNLGRSVKFERNLSSANLFKKYMQTQNQFYDQLQDLPKRLFHAVKNRNLNKIDVAKIKELAFYICIDDDKKVQVLNSISSAYPDTLNLRKKVLFNKIKPYFEKKWGLMIIWILVLSISAYITYSLVGIDKNFIFSSFIGLIGVIAYIIYKK